MTEKRDMFRTMFRVALPAAFHALISFVVVLADDVMVSAVDERFSQAAVTQINSLTALYIACITGLVGGASVLIAQYWGKADTEQIKKIFSIVLWVCLGVAVLFVGAAVCFPRVLVGLVVARNESAVFGYALPYLSIVCFSWLPYAVTTALVGMLRSVEVVSITLYTAVVALFANIGLNYVLIFGKLGLPAMGVAGAALATCLARVIELLLVLWYALGRQKRLPLRFRSFFSFDRALFRDYLTYGVPVGITDAQWALIGLLKAAIVGRLGAVFMAANGIANAMVTVGTLFVFALAGGASVVVGKAVGRGDDERAKAYAKIIQKTFFAFGLLSAALVFCLRVPFISLYRSAADPAVFALAKGLIAIVAVSLIGTCYHAACFVGINRGAGDSRFVAKVDMACGWLVVLPATFLSALVFHASLPVVYLCSRIDQCFKWVIALLRLRGDKWIHHVTK
ncbi:MAG: MATE family efflux transporter [Eubacteriales bacterium]